MRVFDFDLKALQVFVMTVQTGNMTETARCLGLTQSSVSQTLAVLEKSVKAQLLDRSVRPIGVTIAGRYFFDQSTHLLSQAEQTQKVLSQGSFEQLHLVRIALVDSLATALGKPLIEAVKKRTENWTLTTGRSHMHADALISRRVDIIISDDALADNPDICRYPILSEPFVLVVPKHYKMSGEDEINLLHLKQLEAELDFVRYSQDSLIGTEIERYLRRLGIDTNTRLQLDNTFAVLSMVAAGIGWTITTPLCLYQSGIGLDQVNCLPLPIKMPLQRQLTLVCRRHELGDLPMQMAKDSCDIMKQTFVTEYRQTQPWLEAAINVG
ncbi:LysR family transcriptional regulator [Shewanella eurypsychrophilus]|uniref:LysR family transcriptional regulator n=1 Tax=Shewanella eurypsychrophilus TaxID=2593656 RepID=A0ABX6V5B5_9GAMM|nr:MULTISPECIES: LysR family transcriptional regulator [Shewanella]QFU22542.1 LysR family transcriptional regulator [Shewanella sp. YLB-09]QPG57831.1 LysR family transcriptional regulator [Shewanella eurypsychrophilus]